MNLGQLFDYARLYPDDMDGFLFEQKLNKTIAEEFIRIQGKVDGAYILVKELKERFYPFEERIEIMRA